MISVLFPATLQQYAGVYTSLTGEQRVISCEENNLQFFTRGGSKEPLQAYEKDRFFCKNNFILLTFMRDSAGNISSMTTTGTADPVNWKRSAETVPVFKPIFIPADSLEKYTGKYRFSSGFVLSITSENGRLYGTGSGAQQIKQEIAAYKQDRFFAKQLDAQLVFKRNEKGAITGLVKIQQDETYAAKIE